MDGFLLGCSFVPWVVKGASQAMNIKIILDGKATCRHHGMTHKNVVLLKVVTIARTSKVTTAVQHEFLFIFVCDIP
jgi:hypothetical protein